MEKVICEKCGGEFSNRMFKAHVNNAHSVEFDSNKDLDRFVLRERFKLTDEFLVELISEYEELGLVDRLVKKYNIPHKSMSDILTLNGVSLNTFKEACSLPHKHQAYVDTCIERYGVKNVSQLGSIQKKKEKTFMKNYGVDNIFKDKEFIAGLNQILLDKYGVKRRSNPELTSQIWRDKSENEKNEIIERTKETKRSWSKQKKASVISKRLTSMNNRSDVDKETTRRLISLGQTANWDAKTPEERIMSEEHRNNISIAHKKYWGELPNEAKVKRIKALNNGRVSKLETRVVGIFNDNGYGIETQFPIDEYSYDIYIKGSNILIEVNGDFWHANPNKYKALDILPFPSRGSGRVEVTAKSIWEKDEKKLKKARKCGYNVVYLWEQNIRGLNDRNLAAYVINQVIKSLDDSQ